MKKKKKKQERTYGQLKWKEKGKWGKIAGGNKEEKKKSKEKEEEEEEWK